MIYVDRTLLYVEGQIKHKEYERDGQKMTSTSIVVARDGNIVVLNEGKSLHEEESHR